MARERMVTRTVETLVVDCMVCNTATATVETITIKVSATIPSEKLEKHLHKVIDNGSTIFVKALATTVETVLYGMPEDEFIAMAKILPPRTANSVTE